ncbi:YncE family protein [Lactococcus petauri]|uniref:YncE family protein n=1 Tax=Lactococcus petauri TaxID=1940789 RepID=UPI0038532B83
MKKIILRVLATVLLSLGAVFLVYRSFPKGEQTFKTSKKTDFYIMSYKKIVGFERTDKGAKKRSEDKVKLGEQTATHNLQPDSKNNHFFVFEDFTPGPFPRGPQTVVSLDIEKGSLSKAEYPEGPITGAGFDGKFYYPMTSQPEGGSVHKYDKSKTLKKQFKFPDTADNVMSAAATDEKNLYVLNNVMNVGDKYTHNNLVTFDKKTLKKVDERLITNASAAVANSEGFMDIKLIGNKFYLTNRGNRLKSNPYEPTPQDKLVILDKDSLARKEVILGQDEPHKIAVSNDEKTLAISHANDSFDTSMIISFYDIDSQKISRLALDESLMENYSTEDMLINVDFDKGGKVWILTWKNLLVYDLEKQEKIFGLDLVKYDLEYAHLLALKK